MSISRSSREVARPGGSAAAQASPPQEVCSSDAFQGGRLPSGKADFYAGEIFAFSPCLVLLCIKMKYTVINKSLLLRKPCDQLCKIKSDINLLAFVCVISNNFPLLQIKQ